MEQRRERAPTPTPGSTNNMVVRSPSNYESNTSSSPWPESGRTRTWAWIYYIAGECLKHRAICEWESRCISKKNFKIIWVHFNVEWGKNLRSCDDIRKHDPYKLEKERLLHGPVALLKNPLLYIRYTESCVFSTTRGKNVKCCQTDSMPKFEAFTGLRIRLDPGIPEL